LLILAFSGGGTRAAAFAYGVLEELAATPVVLGGRPRRLLDEVDLISAVSGGSFTAAYYGLYGFHALRQKLSWPQSSQ
jgi:NTE family protein